MALVISMHSSRQMPILSGMGAWIPQTIANQSSLLQQCLMFSRPIKNSMRLFQYNRDSVTRSNGIQFTDCLCASFSILVAKILDHLITWQRFYFQYDY